MPHFDLQVRIDSTDILAYADATGMTDEAVMQRVEQAIRDALTPPTSQEASSTEADEPAGHGPWLAQLTTRERLQVAACTAYTNVFFDAGLPGSTLFALVAQLAKLLDKASAHAV